MFTNHAHRQKNGQYNCRILLTDFLYDIIHHYYSLEINIKQGGATSLDDSFAFGNGGGAALPLQETPGFHTSKKKRRELQEKAATNSGEHTAMIRLDTGTQPLSSFWDTQALLKNWCEGGWSGLHATTKMLIIQVTVNDQEHSYFFQNLFSLNNTRSRKENQLTTKNQTKYGDEVIDQMR